MEEFRKLGLNNGNKEATLKGKRVAIKHLNAFCLRKKFIVEGHSYKNMLEPKIASTAEFYSELGGYLLEFTYDKKMVMIYLHVYVMYIQIDTDMYLYDIFKLICIYMIYIQIF
jgi:hypothetical protein